MQVCKRYLSEGRNDMDESIRVILDRVWSDKQNHWLIRFPTIKSMRTITQNKHFIQARFGLHGPLETWNITTKKAQETIVSIPIRLHQIQGEWILGPVIGILTCDKNNSFGGNRADYRDLSKVGKQTHT